MLVTDVQREIRLPHEMETAVTIRMLSWSALETASKARSKAAIDSAEDLNPELLAALVNVRTPDEEEDDSETEREVSARRYDRAAVLLAGIAAWSYSAEVSKENIADLDEPSAKFLHEEIVEYSARSDAQGEVSSAE